MAYSKLQAKLHEIIFEADTKAGKNFDIALLILILISILATMLETVASIRLHYGGLLNAIEWFVTILFAIEYILRIYCSKKPLSYVFSFYGIVDLLSIFPSFLAILNPNTRALSIVRSLRLLRVFRVLKMSQFVEANNTLINALKQSKSKIIVFMISVSIIVFIVGALMYVIEGKANSGFTNIPVAVYWAIVTVTTVGYGDISPVTPLGQFFASLLMIVGYAIIAIPTGIVGAEMMNEHKKSTISTQVCQFCQKADHETDAHFCSNCGHKLN